MVALSNPTLPSPQAAFHSTPHAPLLFPNNAHAPSRVAPIDESALIGRAQRGELDAFNQLIPLYQKLLFSVALRLMRDDHSAADAVQDGLIKAYRGLHLFQGTCLKSWLTRIIINTCYDRLRTIRRRNQESLEAFEDENNESNALIDWRESPHEYAERAELRATIERSLRSLPEEYRVALLLRDIHDHEYEEIAEMTGWPLGTVKSRISRARIALRQRLEHQLDRTRTFVN